MSWAKLRRPGVVAADVARIYGDREGMRNIVVTGAGTIARLGKEFAGIKGLQCWCV